MGAAMGIGLFTQYMQKQKAEREARANASSDILAASARSLGAPTYGHSAAKASARADKIGQVDGVGMLSSYLQKAATPEVQEAIPEPAPQVVNMPPMQGSGGVAPVAPVNGGLMKGSAPTSGSGAGGLPTDDPYTGQTGIEDYDEDDEYYQGLV